MSTTHVMRESLIFGNSPELREKYLNNADLYDFINPRIEECALTEKWSMRLIRIVSTPSRWRFSCGDDAFHDFISRSVDYLVVTIELMIDGARHQLRPMIETLRDFLHKKLPGFVTMGIDLPLRSGTHWCPGQATAAVLFGNRSEAARLIGRDFLRALSTPLTGRGVNVVLIDQGFDRQAAPNFACGWTDGHQQPGAGPPDGHGAMMLRNILDIAPDARIFDCPLIPPTVPGLSPSISDIPAFLGSAFAAWLQMLADIAWFREIGLVPGPWIFVNAWAIYDRRSEVPLGEYTERPGHFFSDLVSATPADGIDVLFCAGNCGQFCPDMRCGAHDRGPGHSIWGANSLDAVLTFGAVRTDTTWLGYASQGPGQPALGNDKPDLAVPSQFSEDYDAFQGNPGTSAATGLGAGVIAALRQKWDSTTITPSEMRAILTAQARQTQGNGWNGWTGHGIIDARAAYMAAEQQHP